MMPPLFAVHGFGYDPLQPLHDPRRLFLPAIAQAADLLAADITLWAWYSYPPTLSDILRAWGAGRWNRYRAAWDAAQAEGRRLAAAARAARDHAGQPVDVVAHSLGAEVVRVAIGEAPGAFRRIALLAGAALVPAMRHTLAGISRAGLAPPGILFVASRDDAVLRYLGRHFCPSTSAPCIGEAGLGPRARCVDIILDDPAHQEIARARGWDLRGDQPGEIADHKVCYEHSGNWPLIQAWLAGDSLADFRSPSVRPIVQPQAVCEDMSCA